MATHKFDVAVVGTGPGGYVSAIRCAQLGLSVATVEDDRPGGVCLNWGCIPTKALLRNAEVVNLMSHAADFGIKLGGFEASYPEAIQRSRRVADRMAKGVEFLFRKNKITLFPGRATLKARNVVEVKGTGGAETLEARAVILATGSEPKSLPGVTIDEKTVISSNGAVRNERAPKSIAVIGAGAVGVEFADVFASYGVQVTILEALPRVVPVEDEEVSKELARTFTRRGITIKTGVKVASVTPGGPGAAPAHRRRRALRPAGPAAAAPAGPGEQGCLGGAVRRAGLSAAGRPAGLGGAELGGVLRGRRLRGRVRDPRGPDGRPAAG